MKKIVVSNLEIRLPSFEFETDSNYTHIPSQVRMLINEKLGDVIEYDYTIEEIKEGETNA